MTTHHQLTEGKAMTESDRHREVREGVEAGWARFNHHSDNKRLSDATGDRQAEAERLRDAGDLDGLVQMAVNGWSAYHGKLGVIWASQAADRLNFHLLRLAEVERDEAGAEIERLRAEIERLRAEIERLRAEIDHLRELSDGHALGRTVELIGVGKSAMLESDTGPSVRIQIDPVLDLTQPAHAVNPPQTSRPA